MWRCGRIKVKQHRKKKVSRHVKAVLDELPPDVGHCGADFPHVANPLRHTNGTKMSFASK